jgi:hypothetical protein
MKAFGRKFNFLLSIPLNSVYFRQIMMNFRVLSVAVIGLLLVSFHEYFMGFAEMQYNSVTNKLELSITVTGHDLEEYLEKAGVEIPPLEDCIGQPFHLKNIEKELVKGFQIMHNDKLLKLDIIGMEVNNKDQAIFYLTSREIERPETLKVRFDLLMNYFFKQQNKLTVFNQGKKEFYSFLKSAPVRTIDL